MAFAVAVVDVDRVHRRGPRVRQAPHCRHPRAGSERARRPTPASTAVGCVGARQVYPSGGNLLGRTMVQWTVSARRSCKRCIDVPASRQGPPAHRRRGAARPCPSVRSRFPSATSCSARRSSRRSPKGSSRSCSAWAASGAPSASSGQRRRRLHDRGRLRGRHHARTRRTKRCARGRTGHTEVVLVVFDPKVTSIDEMLRVFWENHDPTQGMRQGNDVGTQYRSGIYTFDDGAGAGGRGVARDVPGAAARGGLRRDHHRDRAARRPSTTPRTTTSSTSPRTRAATAGSAARV